MRVLVKFFIMICFTAGSLLVAQTPQATPGADQTVRVTGMGAILAGDEAKAYDDAQANALRKAVEQVVGTMITSDVLVQNYQTVEDNIYSQTKGYVKGYVEVGKNKNSLDNTLEVTFDVTVSTASIKDDLESVGLLLRRKGNPRLMVVIKETNMGETTAFGESNKTENTLIDEFKKMGFEFIDQATAKQNMEADAAIAAASGNAREAVALANQYGAEVILVGSTKATTATGPSILGSMKSCQANVEVKAIRADNGSVMATSSAHDKAVHIDETTGGSMAIEKATKKISTDLKNKIIEQWNKDVTSSMKISLQILGVKNITQLQNFQTTLKFYIRGIETIDQRSFAAGTAVLDIQTKGNAQQLAQEMEQKNLEKFTVEVTGVSANKITIKLSDK